MAPKRAADVASLDDVAFRCQFYRRHNFPLPDWFGAKYGGMDAWRTKLTCDCGTTKTIYCQPITMEVWAVNYEHGDDYLLETGLASGEELRKESLARSEDRLAGRASGNVRSLKGRRKKASGE